MTLTQALHRMIQSLEEAGMDTPVLDAQVLTAHALGVERYRLTVDGRRELSAAEEERVFSLLDRRLRSEPVAYITGKKEFYSLEFMVGPGVLIPRPETELLVDLAIYHAPYGGRVLDVGTGSGAIAVSLKHTRRDLIVHATDVSKAAIETARKNCALLLGSDEISFTEGDLFKPVGAGLFDIIVSNPPYVDPELRGRLRADLGYEPEEALYAGAGGGAVIARIIEKSPPHLRPDGIVLLELCPELRELVLEKGREHGFHVSVLNDYAGLARVGILKNSKT